MKKGCVWFQDADNMNEEKTITNKKKLERVKIFQFKEKTPELAIYSKLQQQPN